MRLIDAEDILVGWQRTGIKEYDEGKEAGIDLVLAIIDHLPTIEAKPVVRAHWEQDGVWDICSNCKRSTLQPRIKGLPQYKYCPHCGAQMDESISCSHEDDNHIAEDGKKGVKIPVISMDDVPKIMEEMEK